MSKRTKLRDAFSLATRLIEYSMRDGGEKIHDKNIGMAAYLLGVKHDSGSYRGVFILDNLVVKFPKYNYRITEMQQEAEFINNLRKTKYARHFPRTRYLSGGITIQEKCSPNDELFDEHYAQIEVLARILKVGDLHRGNVGWRYEANGPVPVFIDVEFRNGEFVPVERDARRSWFVL